MKKIFECFNLLFYINDQSSYEYSPDLGCQVEVERRISLSIYNHSTDSIQRRNCINTWDMYYYNSGEFHRTEFNREVYEWTLDLRTGRKSRRSAL